MSIMKRVGWMIIGMVVGVLLTTSVSAVKQRTPDTRLRLTVVSTDLGTATFVKDTKSAGCWLVFSRDVGTAIAQAPPEACQ